MRVTVVSTVLNEADSLPRLLKGLAAQTRPPDEVVVCDGGSSDGTLSILQAEARLPLRAISRPGLNISQGRNAAIEAATGDVIAVTDAGVRLSPQWLEQIAAPFVDDATAAVAGFFRPDPTSVFETAMSATVLPELSDIDPTRFLPSSRSVAFRKHVWRAIGGYPEWLDYCEDLVFDLRLRQRYGTFVFAPEALVYFRPRASLRAFFVQYYRYARGDGKADLWRKRHATRYLAYLLGAPLIVLLGVFGSPWWWLLLVPAALGLFGKGWDRLRRMWGGLTTTHKLQAALWVPIIRIVGDVAKMVGYPVGLWWRWQRRDALPDWRAIAPDSGD